MARRLLKIVAILVAVIGLLTAMVLLAYAKADTEAGYAVLKLIAGDGMAGPATVTAPGPSMTAPGPGMAAPGQGMAGQTCDSGGSCTAGGGSCSKGAGDSDHSCASDGSCATEAGDKESTEAPGESGTEETDPAG